MVKSCNLPFARQLFGQLLPILRQFALFFFTQLWIGQRHFFQSLDENVGNQQTREPFAIRRHDVPGSMLLFRQVQEDLDHDDAIFMHVSLEISQLAVAFLPDVLVEHMIRQILAFNQVVDFDNEDLFIIGSVEDGDGAAFRQVLMAAPEVVVIQFLGGWDFERGYFDTLWIETAHDVFDGAILAGSIHRLQDHQDTKLVVSVENILELDQLLDITRQFSFSLGPFASAAGAVGGKIGQMELLLVTDSEIFDFHCEFLLFIWTLKSVAQRSCARYRRQNREKPMHP